MNLRTDQVPLLLGLDALGAAVPHAPREPRRSVPVLRDRRPARRRGAQKGVDAFLVTFYQNLLDFSLSSLGLKASLRK